MELIKVYGHKSIIQRLKRAVEKNTLPPFMIFSGESGIGKQLTAFYLAQFVFCSQKLDPCGVCESCRKTAGKNHPAVMLISPSGLNIKIDSCAKIKSFLSLQSFFPRRFILVDQAHRMNIQSQNSLLKLLEEPPENTHFILITSQASRLLSTIRSRAQTIHFQKLKLEDLKQVLPEETEESLKTCLGRLDRLHQWKGKEALQEEIFNFWRDFCSKKPLSKNLLSWIKNRESALLTARTFQELIRDARVAPLDSKQWIYPDQEKVYEKMAVWPAAVLDWLFEKALQLERDILSYLDCVLCFENFWQSAFWKIHQRAAAAVPAGLPQNQSEVQK